MLFKSLFLFLSLQLCFSLLPFSYAQSSPGSAECYTIYGRVKIPSLGTIDYILPGKVSNVKVILNGGQRVTFLRPDGYFSFHNMPAGTHLIEVAATGYFFSLHSVGKLWVGESGHENEKIWDRIGPYHFKQLDESPLCITRSLSLKVWDYYLEYQFATRY